MDLSTRLNQIRDSILERLKYPYTPGQMLLYEASMPCQQFTYEAQKFNSRFQSYQMMSYYSTMAPTQKINGAFQRYSQNNERAIALTYIDTIPHIVNASTNFHTAFNKAWTAVPKNQASIARYQNCSKTFMLEFNLFVKQYLQEYPQYFNQSLNFASVDDLLVEIFSGWSELYSGIAGCCSLAKNVYPPPTSSPTAPPKMADKYLDGDALAIQCFEEVNESSIQFFQNP